MRDALVVTAFSLLPQNRLSRAIGRVVAAALPKRVATWAIRTYARFYRVDVSEADLPLDQYPSLLAFFTRRLRPGCRPFDPAPDAVLSPVDGVCAGAGHVRDGRIPQAPGRDFSAAELLSDPEGAARHEGGAYAVLYLSPRDYHRVHTPREGAASRFTHVPGRLFPVFPTAVRGVRDLFARNERLVVDLDTDCGRVAVVLVGAFGVGRIRTVLADETTNDGRRGITRRTLDPPRALARGAELGVFELGSTVVLLFEPGRAALDLRGGEQVRVGARIGRCVAAARS